MDENLEGLRIRAELAERLALVSVEMVLTLGAHVGKQFDLRAYADAISVEIDDQRELHGRRQLADILRQIAGSVERS
jgi:hypothetical protein